MFKPLIALLLLATLCAAEAPTRFRIAARRPSVARGRFLARQQAVPAPAPPAPTGYPAAGVTPEIPFDLPPSSTNKPDVTYLPPDSTYGPPTQPEATYGPPAPHSTYGPPTAAAVTPDAVYGPPENTYLPPEQSVTARDVDLEVDEEEATVDEQQPSEPQPEVRDQHKEEEPAEEEGEEIFVAVADDGSVIAVSNSFDAQGTNDDADNKAAQQPARLVFQRFPQGRRRAPADLPVPAHLIKQRRVRPAKFQLLQRAQQQAQPQGFPFAARYTGW
ncbi:PREDICTED: DNA translocase FtsK 1-like [Rhagoletis zephyria]|uniref:DNA translocase FtsK 1-like n=1 Tax=Rhagoletis zephyria TaxID=28612 RepID=UPI00081149A9|nr:PREDICTED: DNA translocase FtsK 1-like [Rhagoletis zephyria]